MQEKFDDGFKDATEEMVKLQPKKQQKLSRKEKVARRKEREDELTRVLREREQTDGTIDADTAVRVADGAGLTATELS